jgi:dTDP-4-dehydrorhamnose 3,5-epimerase
LSEVAIFNYKWSYSGKYPDVDEQFTLRWDDDRININWPVKEPILSERDKNAPLLDL